MISDNFNDVEVGDTLEEHYAGLVHIHEVIAVLLNFRGHSGDPLERVVLANEQGIHNLATHSINARHWIDFNYRIVKKAAKPTQESSCTCDIFTLMSSGCKCGNFSTG